MTTDHAPEAAAPRRPVAITIAVVVVYVSGLFATALGILILLSRYDVAAADVLPVSLVGAAVILFGLLTISAGSSIARGSSLARLMVTVYVGILLALHVLTIATTDRWDWSSLIQPALIVYILVVLWVPPMARYFTRTPASA